MKKLLIRLYLTILVISAGAYHQVYAQVVATAKDHSTITTENVSKPGKLAVGFFSKSANQETPKQFFAVDVTELREQEEDEHELITLHFSALLSLDQLYTNKDQRLPSGRHISISPSLRRHLFVQVFRI